MKPDQFRKQISQGEVPAICLLYGEEALFIAETVALIRKKLFSGPQEKANAETYYGDDVEPAAVLQSVSTVSLFASKRLVLVKNVDRMAERKRALFLDYFDHPAPAIYLIFTAEKADMRTKFFSRLQKKWPAIRYYHPYNLSEVEKWIRSTLKKDGFSIDTAAARLLTEGHGRTLSVLRNELDKVMLYKGNEGNITVSDVAAVSGQSREFNPFELADAVGDRDVERSLGMMNRLFQDGVPTILVLAAMTALFRRLWAGKTLEAEGRTDREILSALQIRYKGERFLAQLRRFDQRELAMIYPHFVRIDEAIKTGRSHPEMMLESLILRICRGKSMAPLRPAG
ncbi:MAG: DNA polymerase III subunit delta [bacterium]|nr:DNA polymerase III subunit delta [bacterium]